VKLKLPTLRRAQGRNNQPGFKALSEEKMFGVRNPLVAAVLNWIISRLEPRQPKAVLTR
jgi:hypothetical protein